ncbi:MAG: GAF domain-containing protein [Microcoleaceae cyanobacterium]
MSNNNSSLRLTMTEPMNEPMQSTPIHIESEVQPPFTAQPQALGLKAKTTALARELSVLRLNIDSRVNQLQSLIEREGAAAERAELLNEITSAMRESLNPQNIFRTAVEQARVALQSDRVAVYQFDPQWQGTIVSESVDPQWPSALGAMIADPCFADRYVEFYQAGRVKATSDIYNAGLTECHLNQLEPFKVRANLVAPIVANQQLMGLFIAHQCSGSRVWLEPEIEFFRQLAVQLGYALDQALLLQQQQVATRQAQLLNHITAQIRQSLDVDNILVTTVEEARAALECDRVIVYEFDAKWQGTIIAESVDAKWPNALGAMIADPCFAQRYIQPYLRGRVRATEDIENAGLTECYLNQLRPFEVKANLVAPIVVNQKLMGLLIAHQCSAPRAWTELEIDLMRQVGIQLGYTLDQAYLLKQQQAAARQARSLNEITTKLRNFSQPQELFELIVEEAKVVLQCDRLLIYQLDEDWMGTVVAEAVSRGWSKTLGRQLKDPCIPSHFGKLYLRGRVSKIENVNEDGLEACHVEMLESYEAKANMVAPIVAENRLNALLIAQQCSGPRIWQESEISFIQQLATQVSLALDQVILLQKQESAAEQARRLNRTSSRIRESLVYSDILDATVEETHSALNADRVVVYQFDANWQGTIVAESVSAGFPEALGANIDDPCFAQNYVKPYLKGRVQATADIYEANLTECYLKQLEPFEVRANLVAPIITNQKLHGLLIAHQCSGPRKWSNQDIDLLRQIAVQVGYALDQSSLLEQQRIATQQACWLSETGSRIRESLDFDQILQTAVQELLPLMQGDQVLVHEFNNDWQSRIRSSASKLELDLKFGAPKPTTKLANYGDFDPELAGFLAIHAEFSPTFSAETVKLYRQGQVHILSDIAQADLTQFQIEQLHQQHVKASLSAPIFINQNLYGLIEVQQCSQPRTWINAETELLKQVALQIGYALEQAQLLQQVQQARQIAEQVSTEQQQQKQVLEHQIETFLGDIENSFEGDLTVRARVTEGVMGTVADFFNATIENLQQLVVQVTSAANVVNGTAQNSEAAVKNLSQAAVNQAEAIANALSQIQTMASATQTVAQSAKAAETQVLNASQILQQSDVAMNRTVEGITAIQKTVYATARRVKNLGDASKKISRVVQLISEFANQTHILALNASVETTRTNQEDLGFATVASEVRSLAEQSATATQEIEQIVEEIQTETQELIQAMKVGMKRVILGTTLVNETRQTLTNLVEVSQHIRVQVEDIAQSATSQAQTSSELSATVEAVAAIAHSTSEYSVKVAESFNQLLTVAGDLQKGVAQFKA